MKLMIVESPAKVKTISKYLGDKFQIVASLGHVRDLPSKTGSVVPEQDFLMKYEVDTKSKKILDQIKNFYLQADTLYLATDPDREGESISWHILEYLKSKKVINNNTSIKRIVFNQITKKAIVDSIKNAREIDMDLVNAQQARRALDYLFGFTLSPVLWRKCPGSRSAGRVQSVSLRLICDREEEIEQFIKQEYWSIYGHFLNIKTIKFIAELSHINNTRVKKLDINNRESAYNIKNDLLSIKQYLIDSVEKKQIKRNPKPPFITSTLQQEAHSKLGFSTKKTMQVAQKLYEGMDVGGEAVGLITYMRTDSFFISTEGIKDMRSYISKNFNDKYLPKVSRKYDKKTKQAQEAHEAIRPTKINRTPEILKQYLDKDQLALYKIIWCRALASQMESAIFDNVIVIIAGSTVKDSYKLSAKGSVLVFDGFRKLYIDSESDDQDKLLPDMQKGESCELEDVKINQHFTQPPPRYTEASLVKKMEEIGIGRPSTYATIISVIQDRKYVTLENKKFIPEMRGRVVTLFLINFFTQYIEYNFTANLEEELDKISEGQIEWKLVMKNFWNGFYDVVQKSSDFTITDVLETMNKHLEKLLFFNTETQEVDKKCPKCNSSELTMKFGKFGVFVGCRSYPECKYIKNIDQSNSDNKEIDENDEFPILLGRNEKTGADITIRKGPYGLYIQDDSHIKSEEVKDKEGKKKKSNTKNKLKRVSIPAKLSKDDVDLNQAKFLLSLPKVIGQDDSNEDISIGIGRYGPFVLYKGKFHSVKDIDKFMNITLEDAKSFIKVKKYNRKK